MNNLKFKHIYYLIILSVALSIVNIFLVHLNILSYKLLFIIFTLIVIIPCYYIYKEYDSYIVPLLYLLPITFISEYRFDFILFRSTPTELLLLLIAILYLINFNRKVKIISFVLIVSMFFFLLNSFFIESGSSVTDYFGKVRRVILPFLLVPVIFHYRCKIDHKLLKLMLITLTSIYIIPAIIGLIQYTTGNLFVENMLDASYEYHKEANAAKYFISTILGLPSQLSRGLTPYANNFAYYLVYVIINTLTLFYLTKSKIRYLYIFILILFEIVLLTTYSRAGIIFSVFLIVLFMFIYRYRRFYIKTIFIALTLGIIIALFIINYLSIGSLMFRVDQLFAAFTNLDLKTLLFGQSILSYQLEYRLVPHNNYAGFIYDNGIILFSIYFGIIYYIFIKYSYIYSKYNKFIDSENVVLFKGQFVLFVYLMFMESFNYYSFNGINRITLVVYTVCLLMLTVTLRNSFNLRSNADVIIHRRVP